MAQKKQQGLVAAQNPQLAKVGRPLPAPNTRWPVQLPFGPLAEKRHDRRRKP